MRVVCVKKRWKHHTTGSGYDRLTDYLDADVVQRRDLQSFPGRGAQKLWNKFVGSPDYLLDYQLGDRIAEEQAFWLSLRSRADIVHVLYGDEQLDVLLRRASYLPGRLVATFHLPASRVQERFEHIQKQELSRLAGAVVVGKSEVEAFSHWLGPDKVMYVPHGIDVSSFQPAHEPSGSRCRFLLVGAHMRDFEVAHRVIDLCSRKGLDADFDLVVPSYGRDFFTGCDRVTFHTGIDNAALQSLYHRATALFLPLIHATANNAILESLASGTPVISTDVGGINDYGDAPSGWLLPVGDVDAAFARVEAIIQNPSQAHDLRPGARRKAESFGWERIAAQLRDAYGRLCANQSFADADPGSRLLG